MQVPTLFAATGLAVVLVIACTPPEERAEKAREALQQALGRGDREAALDAIDDLRASAPDTPEALLEIAQLRVQAGDAPRAGWLLEEGTRRFPERDDVRLALARVALLLGNPSLARDAVVPIAAGSEQHAAALVTRAQAELGLGDLERALETLAEAERLYPDRPEARLVRIATLLSEHRQDEASAAIEEARAALAGDEKETEVLRRRLDVTLAQIQAQQGEPEAAAVTLTEMVQTSPEDILAWRALLQVLAQQERREEALSLLEGALQSDESEESPLDLYPLAAQVHAALGQEDEAEAALRAFVARSESPAAYLPLVNHHSAQDDAQTTAAVLEEAIARFPDEPTLRLLYTETLLAQERIEDARAEFRRFRNATFDGDPQVEYLRARMELAEGDAEAAVERLTKLAPRLDSAATQFWLGWALEESGDTEGARRRYGLARQRDRSGIAPAAALVALEGRRGDWRAAAGHARLLVQRAPQRLDGWIALVSALENLREGKAAEAVARQSLEQFPGRAEPHLLLARALRTQGRHDEALEALAAAEAAGGSGTPLEAERVLTLGMGGRLDEGIAIARGALASEPDSVDLHAALAAMLFAAGAAEEGTQATDRALALDPDEPRPLRVRCEFRAASGRWPGARDDCTRYLEARPDDAGAHFMLGLAYTGLGQAQQAIASYRRAAQLDERDARPRNNLADLLATQGDLDGALAAAQEAYRLDEADPYVMDTLGALYLRKGLVERAVSLLEEAHAGAPDLPEATLHLVLAYAEAGRTDEARVLLEGLRQSDAGDETLRAQVEEALHSLP
jgi:tetratricopeptide (TPR) repeat protein